MATKNSGGVDVVPSNLSDYTSPLNKSINDLTGLIRDYRDVALPAGAADYTLLVTDVAPEGRSPVVRLTGTLTANRNVLIPTTGGLRIFIIWNDTSGAFTVTVKTTAGGSTGIAIPQGFIQFVFHDGTNVYAASPPVLRSTNGAAAVRVTNAAAQAIGSGAATALTFDQERRDDGGLHSTSVNTDQIIVPRDGWGVLSANVEFDSNATGFRAVSFRKNGSATANIIFADSRNAVSGDTTAMGVSCSDYFLKGDVLRCYVFQNSGVALNVRKSGAYSPEFALLMS